jgi:hypothetical protein
MRRAYHVFAGAITPILATTAIASLTISNHDVHPKHIGKMSVFTSLTSNPNNYIMRTLGHPTLMAQNLIKNYNMSMNDAETVINMNGDETKTLDNGIVVYSRRSDWYDNEYYIDMYIDGLCVHSQYHYDG